MHCIYTNSTITSDNSNIEHIIPLSLGGKNGFTIRVNKNANSDLGDKLDGAIVKDFFINHTKRAKGYIGHSKKITKYKINATIATTGEKVEIRYIGKDNYLYNPKTKKRYTEEEKKQSPLNISTPFTVNNLRIRFVAKVLLGTGYFIYGDAFKEYADHKSLRRIMDWNLLDKNNKLVNIPVGLIDEFSEVTDKSEKWDSTLRIVCKAIDSSCVILIIAPKQIIGAVGIGGRYIGAINFKANGRKLGYKKGPADGIIIAIQNNKIIKTSFHKFLKKIQDLISAKNNC